MTAFSGLQIGLYLTILLLLVRPLGAYMTRVYEGERTFLSRVMGPIERLVHRVLGVRVEEEMDWKKYTVAALLFGVVGLVALYGLERLQSLLPLKPPNLGAVQYTNAITCHS